MALAILVGITWNLWFLWQNGYLPPPFFYDPGDTYADWFNPAFWARNEGTYDVWKTLYPPISFVFLRLVGINSCYPDRRGYDFSAGLAGRSCDWVGVTAIWMIFAINVALLYWIFRKRDPASAIPRTVCVGLGLPMLAAVERGNLVLVSFTCMLLAFGPILRSAHLRWLMAGLAVNFKVYLVAAIVPLLLKRRWRWVEGALLATVIVYLLSFALLGRGTLPELVSNISDFAALPAVQIMDQWYTTTYQPLTSLVEGDNLFLVTMLGSRLVDLLAVLLPALKHGTQATIAIAAAAAWLRPETVPVHRVINLGILMALVTSEPGGYTMMYFMVFVMMEPWRGFGPIWAIVACYLLALPLDIILDKTAEVVRETYFSDTWTLVRYSVTVGPFLRPLIIMSIAWALSAATIAAVWRDIRHQGGTRRWRFRREWPLAQTGSSQNAAPAPPAA